MCATSIIIEQWQNPQSSTYVPWPQIRQDPMLAWQMADIIKRLEDIDERLGTLERCKVSAKSKRNFKRRLKRAAGKSDA